MVILGIIHIFSAFLVGIFASIERYPAMKLKHISLSQQFETKKKTNDPDDEDSGESLFDPLVNTNPYRKIIQHSQLYQTVGFISRVFFSIITGLSRHSPIFLLLLDWRVFYCLVYIGLSVLGLLVSPFFYCILLFDIFQISAELRNILRSFTLNLRKLAKTAFFLIVVIYFFSFLGYIFISADYQVTTNESLYCQTMFQCFISTLDYGLRLDGGIGTALRSRKWDDEYYFFAIVFRLVFFLVVNLFIIIMIQGIIIDTFQDLRTQFDDLLELIDKKCLLCGDSKSSFESRRGMTWHHHLKSEHNIFDFIVFIIYVTHKRDEDCDDFERYAKRIFETRNIEGIRELFKI
jgi:hypothetical protein